MAQYQDGAMVNVDGAGMFAGSDTGIFETVVTCVTTPGLMARGARAAG